MDRFAEIYDKAGTVIYLLAISVFVIVMARGIWRKVSAKPVENIPAKVLYKQAGTDSSYDIVQGYATTKTTLSIAFEVQGKTLTLYTGEGFYHLLKKGDRGLLTYQAGRLIDFQLMDRHQSLLCVSRGEKESKSRI